MKKAFYLSIVSLFILLNYSCSSDDGDLNLTPSPNNPSTVVAATFLDVSYGADSDQKYDIYLEMPISFVTASLGGEIEVKSVYGKGSKFTVTLPFEYAEETASKNIQ